MIQQPRKVLRLIKNKEKKMQKSNSKYSNKKDYRNKKKRHLRMAEKQNVYLLKDILFL